MKKYYIPQKNRIKEAKELVCYVFILITIIQHQVIKIDPKPRRHKLVKVKINQYSIKSNSNFYSGLFLFDADSRDKN